MDAPVSRSPSSGRAGCGIALAIGLVVIPIAFALISGATKDFMLDCGQANGVGGSGSATVALSPRNPTVSGVLHIDWTAAALPAVLPPNPVTVTATLDAPLGTHVAVRVSAVDSGVPPAVARSVGTMTIPVTTCGAARACSRSYQVAFDLDAQGLPPTAVVFVTWTVHAGVQFPPGVGPAPCNVPEGAGLGVRFDLPTAASSPPGDVSDASP
jgi:hypothetical protein